MENKVIVVDGDLPNVESGAHLRVKKRTSGKTTPYIGVYWEKKRQKWRASFSYTDSSGKQHRRGLGYFDDDRDAAKAYDRMAVIFNLPTNILKKVSGTDVAKTKDDGQGN
jgi:hypothetical protein